MARRNAVPSYRLHKGSGQAFVYHRSIANKSHRLYLGKYGSDASKQKYRQFLKRLELAEVPSLVAVGVAPTIHRLIRLYDSHAVEFYKQEDGTLRREYYNQRAALRLVMDLFGTELAAEFGPKCLKTIQYALIAENNCRNHINEVTGRVKRLFRWACAEELIPPSVYHGLLCVRGLRLGEHGVRESDPVRPAKESAIMGVLPFVSPVIGAMVQVQHLCAMRPNEVYEMKASQVDRSGSIWLYTPRKHKTQRYGHRLVKAIPVAAQSILGPFLDRCDSDGYVFKPSESAEAMRALNASTKPPRKTKRYPSEVRRIERAKREKGPAKLPADDRFAKDSYRQALDRGFAKAAKEGAKIERFTPNQLRHSMLTYVSRELGQQPAQRYAGHAHLSTTSVYAEIELAEIVSVAERLDELWSQAT